MLQCQVQSNETTKPRCFSQQVTMVTFMYGWSWELDTYIWAQSLIGFNSLLRFKPQLRDFFVDLDCQFGYFT